MRARALTSNRAHFWRVLPLAAGLTALAVLAAACGGSTSAGGPSVVKIGLLVDLTGDLGSYGKVWENSFELARDEINQAGGLPGGAKIETVVQDEKTSAQVAVAAAQQMIDLDHVSAIVGPTSEAMVALVPLAQRDKIPVLSEAAGTITLNKLGGQYIYRTVASDNSDGLAAAKFVADQGATSTVVLYENAESPASVGTTFQTSFTKLGGTVTDKVAINPGQSSYQAEVAKALAGNPAWIFCACGQQTSPTILKEAASAGYRGKWMLAADSVVPDTIKAAGASVMNGDYGESAAADTNLPAYKVFAQAYAAKYGQSQQDLSTLFAANAYDAMILVGLAMVQAGSTTGQAINDNLRKVANPPGTTVTSYAQGVKEIQAGHKINYEGASGPVDFDSSGTVTSAYSISQVQSGQWVEVKFYSADVFAGLS